MGLLDYLERRLGRWAVPNVTLYIVIGQAAVYFATLLHRINPTLLLFIPRLVLAGQWWRAGTFLFIPPQMGLIFVFFAWWIFYLMGSALEEGWGAFRYNVFLLCGYVLSVGLAFIDPDSLVTNSFLGTSIFLAFAALNPNFELLILFILPVKVKWLALLAWAYYALQLVVGGWSDRLQVFGAIGNILLFFGPQAWRRAGQKVRAQRFSSAARPAEAAGKPRHRCRICGKTDLSNPEMDFRYCSKCAGEACYCPEHIFNHEHVREDEAGVG